MKANYKKYRLNFKKPGGTSRGVLHTKETFFLFVRNGDKIGIGECGIFRGLSIDDRPDYEEKLDWLCTNINSGKSYLLNELREYPSIQFGLEQALLSIESTSPFNLFPSSFSCGEDKIDINGLIWMGPIAAMRSQIEDKLGQGYTTLKMKIGAIDFEEELNLLKQIRNSYSADEIELRVDANGAFSFNEALEKLKRLSELEIHSIEQPIKAGHWEEMAHLCKQSPLPIALDEELIGIFDVTKKEELLQIINPQFIILKPSLIGGFRGSDEWIELARNLSIGWWVTSALESNIGLNAISQWTYTLASHMPQGLGTGSLFTNNIGSPLEVVGGSIRYNPDLSWDLNRINESELN